MATLAAPTPGTEIHFDNGGWVEIDMVEDGWVFYAVYRPGSKSPALCKKTIADWHDSLAFTRNKIAKRRAP